MLKRFLALMLCLVLFVLLLPAASLAAEDYDEVTIKSGDTIRKLLKANGRDFDTDKYVVMVLNGWTREKQMDTLSIGDTVKIPKSIGDIVGRAPHLISSKDRIEYYVIPYVIQKGDTVKFIYKLWGLKYDDYVAAIEALNPERNLELVYPGDLLYLPTTEKNLTTNTYITVMSHTMLQDESVESVFLRYGQDYEGNRANLQSFNTADFADIKAGDKLLIPLL